MRVADPAVHVSVTGGFATLQMASPPVNALGQAMRAALLAAIRSLQGVALSGVILRGAGGNFVGGADLREFDAPPLEPQLPDVIEALEQLPVPVVAVITGAALGGGLELALGCDARIAGPDAVLGLPEVSLGLIPGAGGTLRLPRLVGLATGVDLICSGRRVGAAEALRLGVVDAVSEQPDNAARAWLAQGRKRLLRNLPVRRDDSAAAEARAIAAAPGALAVPAAIAAIHDSATLPVDEALRRERAVSLSLRRGPQSRALRHLFFAGRRAGRVAEPPAPVAEIGVSGDDERARSLAAACAAAGFAVRRAGPDLADLLACDLILAIQAGHGTMLADLARSCRLGTTLAIVAPGRELDLMSAGLPHPERVVGVQFAEAADAPVAEILRGERTADEAVAALAVVLRRLGKVPVIVRAASGGIGPRLHAASRAQAQALVAKGVPPHQIDAALRGAGTVGGAADPDDARIFADLVQAMQAEGGRLLDAGDVARSSDIDLVMVLGYGFPDLLGGPMFHAAECAPTPTAPQP